MLEPWGIVLSCEHAVNRVPPQYARLFTQHRTLLKTHQGYDIGSLELAQHLSDALDAPLFIGSATRLLVDLNRTVGNPTLFSEITESLPFADRARLLEEFYVPYRRDVEVAVRDALQSHERVLHLSLHTFAPKLNGEVRTADIGLLYDPKQPGERAFCTRWRKKIQVRWPQLRVRLNYPYRGDADGLTTYLRRRLQTGRYLGIELEVNQKLLPANRRAASPPGRKAAGHAKTRRAQPASRRNRLQEVVIESLRQIMIPGAPGS